MTEEAEDDALRFWEEVDRYMLMVSDPEYGAWVDEQCAMQREGNDSAYE